MKHASFSPSAVYWITTFCVAGWPFWSYHSLSAISRYRCSNAHRLRVRYSSSCCWSDGVVGSHICWCTCETWTTKIVSVEAELVLRVCLSFSFVTHHISRQDSYESRTICGNRFPIPGPPRNQATMRFLWLASTFPPSPTCLCAVPSTRKLGTVVDASTIEPRVSWSTLRQSSWPSGFVSVSRFAFLWVSRFFS